MIVTKERKYLFIHKVALENTQQKTSHVENSRLFVKKVSTRVAKYLNTIASILRENMHGGIFVLGHYLFLEAHFLPRSSIKFFP